MTTSKLAHRRVLMRRMWNDGDSSHSDIAVATGLTMDTVAKWLAEQPGYPGIIGAKVLKCMGCNVEFPSWRSGVKYCSVICRREAMRCAWFRSRRRRLGLPVAPSPPRQRWRGAALSAGDKRVMDEAKREARERGTTRDVVLREWKFEPQRNTGT